MSNNTILSYFVMLSPKEKKIKVVVYKNTKVFPNSRGN